MLKTTKIFLIKNGKILSDNTDLTKQTKLGFSKRCFIDGNYRTYRN